MAQLKDTTISGSLRATDTIYSITNQFKILNIPTASDGTTYGPGSSGQVLKSNGTSVYWASDNDVNVAQTATTTSAAYEVLFSGTADNTTRTEGTRKTSTFTYNPNTKALVTGGTVNGYTLAAASAKGVTDNSSNADVTSSDTNLITGRTLYYQLAKKGYTTNAGTVTSVQVQASSPLQSSTSSAQSTSLNTTISFIGQSANTVLAGPSSGSSTTPGFRALVAADIPNLSANKITSDVLNDARIAGLTSAEIDTIVGTIDSGLDNGNYYNKNEINSMVSTQQNNFQTLLDAKLNSSALLNLVYPVGSIYMSINNTNPSSFIGGTWVAFGAGRVLVSVDPNDADFNASQMTGGEKTVTLTIDEMPTHSHGYRCVQSAANGNDKYVIGTGTTSDYAIVETGGSQPHNNMPPYITCYMWKRTA